MKLTDVFERFRDRPVGELLNPKPRKAFSLGIWSCIGTPNWV